MKNLKKIIKKYFSSFAYFYGYLRYRIFIVLFLNILIGLLDGLGLTMFLPLLQMVDGTSEATGENMGNMAFIVDGFNKMGISLTLTTALLILFLFFSLKGLISFYFSAYKVKVNLYFISSLRIKLTRLFTNYSYNAFVSSDMGHIQNSFTGEAGRVSGAYKQYSTCVQQLITVLIYLGFVFLVDWQFAILVCLGGLISNIFFRRMFKITKAESRKLTANNSKYQGLIIQYVTNFKYLKATGFLKKYARKLIHGIRAVEQNNAKIGILNARMSALREPFMIGIVCLAILFQILVLGGNMAAILLSLLFFYRALTALISFQSTYNGFLAVSGSLDNIMNFEKEIKRNTEKDGRIKIEKFRNQIVIDHVDFGYDFPDQILKNINLVISKNQSVAFVGESGSGKTTLANLVSGLLRPTHGDILVDGISFQDLNFESYHSRVGYISQEAVIFNDTIFNNVTLWSPKSENTIDRFQKAIEKAAIAEFIDTLNNKENTKLGNNGINLSGGQKQRISIARELFKEIDILILDEATSALDSETEREIQTNLDQLKGDYTLFTIAHRLSTVKNADIVYLMDNGKISAKGSFNELILKSERFRKMVELQELRTN